MDTAKASYLNWEVCNVSDEDIIAFFFEQQACLPEQGK